MKNKHSVLMLSQYEGMSDDIVGVKCGEEKDAAYGAADDNNGRVTTKTIMFEDTRASWRYS